MRVSLSRRSALRLLPTSAYLLYGTAHEAFAQQVEINAPYLETPPAVVDAMLLLAHIKPSDVVYDLGCGDGRIVIHAARQYGARGVGIDNNPERIRQARENAQRAGVGNRAQFRAGDLFEADVTEATLVTLYLLPDINLKLRPKLQRELRRGTRIVSHSFDMGAWKPDRQQIVAGEKLYVWTLPGREPIGK